MKLQIPARSFHVPALNFRERCSRFPSFAKSVWERFTFSRLTIFYLVFSLVHFILQLSLQLRAFTINQEASSLLSNVLVTGNANTAGVPMQQGSTISICEWVSNSLVMDDQACRTVWAAPNDVRMGMGSNAAISIRPTSIAVSSTPAPSVVPSTPTLSSVSSSTPVTFVLRPATTTTVFVIATSAPVSSKGKERDQEEDDDIDDKVRRKRAVSISSETGDDGKPEVIIRRPDGQPEGVINEACLESLRWPAQVLRNTIREDIVFVAFQFWVLGMSLVALMNESIPHILASLLTHMMATAWAGFQISHTASFKKTYGRVITNGACRAAGSLLPEFWEQRTLAEYPSLALHGVALIISAALTWKLMKLYGWQTFKRVGASLTINRIYKMSLILFITLQISLFFIVATVGLWLDQLLNSSIGDLATYIKLYKASSIITLLLVIPWLMMGWFGVRKERRDLMFGFLFLCIMYLGGWGVMFFSATFKWTFITWRFFSVMASASVLLTCFSFLFGVLCRMNFGKGLLRYLDAEEILDDKMSISDEKRRLDIESVPFPSNDYFNPKNSYSDRSSLSTYTNSLPRENPFQPVPTFLTSPERAITRNVTDVPQVKRQGSTDSKYSEYSYSLSDGGHARTPSKSSQRSQGSAKRWVIE